MTKDILLVLANSDVPLSSQQIYNKMILKSKYIFERLRQLNPDKFEYNNNTFLFDLGKLIENVKNRDNIKPLIEKIVRHFKSNWLIDDAQIITNYYCFIGTLSFPNQTVFEIFNKDKDELIQIKWSFSGEDYTLGKIFFYSKNDTIKLKVENLRLKHDINGKIAFHWERKNKNYKIKFLDVILKDNIEINDPLIKKLYEKFRRGTNDLSIVVKMIAELMSNNEYYNYEHPHYERRKKIEIIFYDSRNWRYEINLKGFFLYLYIQSIEIRRQEYIKKNRKEKKNKRYENVVEKIQRKIVVIKNEVKRLLSNKIIQRKCPFLKLNEDFMRAGFNTVDVLLDLAYEIFPQIDYYEDIRSFSELYVASVENNMMSVNSQSIYAYPPQKEKYFQWNICKRYSYEIEKYFQKQNIDNSNILDFLLGFKEYSIIYKKLLEYRLYMANILRNLIIFEKKNLIRNYSIWYPKYLKMMSKDIMVQQNYPNLNEFEKLVNL